MKDSYIAAALQAIQTGTDPETVVSGLRATLARRGHSSLYKKVLEGVLRGISVEQQNTRLFVASDTDAVKHKEAITQALQSLKADPATPAIVDETLIGGFVAERNNVRLDASYKTKLIDLYRSIVT